VAKGDCGDAEEEEEEEEWNYPEDDDGFAELPSALTDGDNRPSSAESDDGDNTDDGDEKPKFLFFKTNRKKGGDKKGGGKKGGAEKGGEKSGKSGDKGGRKKSDAGRKKSEGGRKKSEKDRQHEGPVNNPYAGSFNTLSSSQRSSGSGSSGNLFGGKIIYILKVILGLRESIWR
jgi:hypothetical protein